MKSSSGLPRWVFFVTGFASGFFLAFLIYLWKFVPGDPAAPDIANFSMPELPKAETSEKKQDAAGNASDEMKWDFYEIFPKSEVPVVEEYGPDGTRSKVEEPRAWLLQAGSFRSPDDADQLRAKLILLGLDVFSKEIKVDGTRWYRVLVGPLHSRLELDRTRDKLAQARIESIPLRVAP